MYEQFNYSTKWVSGPSAEPVSIDEILKQLKYDAGNNYDEGDLMRKASAARKSAEGELGKRIGAQVWDIFCDFWPGWNWRLPLDPLRAITGVYWTDLNGVESAADPLTYSFSANSGRLWLKPGYLWPAAYLPAFSGIRIRVSVGIDPVPANIKEAILLRVGTLDNIREDMTLGTVQQAASVGTFEALLGVDRNIGI